MGSALSETSASVSGLSENLRAAGCMAASMAGFATSDACFKSLAGVVPISQGVFVRGLMASLLIGALAWRGGAHRFRPGRRDLRVIAVRIVAEIGATVTFLFALFHMPLANLTAILQSVPLALTLGAALVFGEPVGWRRYAAIAIGFFGVLVIVRPGSDGFGTTATWALVSVGFIVARELATRRLTPEAPATAVVVVTTVAVTLAAGLAGPFEDWQPLAGRDVALLAGSGAGMLFGYVTGVTAMRHGEIGFVQPFRYTGLIWAMLYGALIFGERPDVWVIVGSAIVVATGIFTIHRERQALPGRGRA